MEEETRKQVLLGILIAAFGTVFGSLITGTIVITTKTLDDARLNIIQEQVTKNTSKKILESLKNDQTRSEIIKEIAKLQGFKIFSGDTGKGLTNWEYQREYPNMISTRVDTSEGNFQDVPHYMPSLHADNYAWRVGSYLIYDIKKDGFTFGVVDLLNEKERQEKNQKLLDAELAEQMNEGGWHVVWYAITAK